MNYVTKAETTALVRRATDNEKWLNEQLNRIAPHRGQIGEDADRMALEELVFELRDKLVGRKPLTESEITTALENLGAAGYTNAEEWFEPGVRYAELAHKIGEELQ